MAESIFPAPVRPLPEPLSSAAILVLPGSESPAPIRFVEGFEEFASYVCEQGGDPANFVQDISALWGFLDRRKAVLESVELADSAARFVGNVIAVVHPAASWRRTPELEVGTSTRSIPVAELVRIMVEQSELVDEFMDMLSSWSQADQDAFEMSALMEVGSQPLLRVPPVRFERPALPQQDYLDAVIEYLQAWYVVDVERRTVDQETRTVLRPSTGATVTIAAAVDSVQIQGGALFRTVVPQCSCDACDESAESVADEVEDTLLAIAAGGLREVCPVGHRRWQHAQLCHLGGERHSSNGEPDPNLTADELEQATKMLRELDDGWWPAWTFRTDLAQSV
ncbi:DUF6226 family protein [Microbacterium sp. NPDC076768]|uniref:DUF6226 family protein n=1 Tax=Microbacterium sp. NPDC076768 TaxID=3154858 RepID=UPI003412B871